MNTTGRLKLAATIVAAFLLPLTVGPAVPVAAATGDCYVNMIGVPTATTLPVTMNISFEAVGACEVYNPVFPSVSFDLFTTKLVGGRLVADKDTGILARGRVVTPVTDPITFHSIGKGIGANELAPGTYVWNLVGTSVSSLSGDSPITNDPQMVVKGTPPPPVIKASYSVNRGTKYTGTASGRRVYNIYGQAYLCKTATACNSGGTPIANATLVLQVYRSGAWAYLTTAKTTATGGSATAKVSTSGKAGTLKLRWVVSASGTAYKASPGSTPFYI